jgi:hypothetical protein
MYLTPLYQLQGEKLVKWTANRRLSGGIEKKHEGDRFSRLSSGVEPGTLENEAGLQALHHSIM